MTFSGKILVIDDEPTMIKLTKDIFETFELSADFALSAEDAFCFLENNCYDLMLLDMKLPNMSGFDFFKKLKLSIPVLIVSGFRKEDVMEKFLNEKDVTFLQKPFSVQELLNMIEKSHNNFVKKNFEVS